MAQHKQSMREVRDAATASLNTKKPLPPVELSGTPDPSKPRYIRGALVKPRA